MKMNEIICLEPLVERYTIVLDFNMILRYRRLEQFLDTIRPYLEARDKQIVVPAAVWAVIEAMQNGPDPAKATSACRALEVLKNYQCEGLVRVLAGEMRVWNSLLTLCDGEALGPVMLLTSAKERAKNLALVAQENDINIFLARIEFDGTLSSFDFTEELQEKQRTKHFYEMAKQLFPLETLRPTQMALLSMYPLKVTMPMCDF